MRTYFDWFRKYFNYQPIIKLNTIDMELYNKYKTLLSKGKINTKLRLAHFFGQIRQESNLKPVEESLNYSVDALISLFGRHRISIQDANKYGRKSGQRANQEMLANILYGGKWGLENLGNKYHGDGWKYKGGGLKQITGRGNYEKLSKDTGIDFINKPELILEEANAMISAIWFWNDKNINTLADKDDVKGVTKKINGGTNGLDKRIQYTNEYKRIFSNV